MSSKLQKNQQNSQIALRLCFIADDFLNQSLTLLLLGCFECHPERAKKTHIESFVSQIDVMNCGFVSLGKLWKICWCQRRVIKSNLHIFLWQNLGLLKRVVLLLVCVAPLPKICVKNESMITSKSTSSGGHPKVYIPMMHPWDDC